MDTISRIEVLEHGQSLAFSFEDMMRYHGPGSPGGVAHAFKVMERAFPELGPAGSLERRELSIRTAFGGPGARDAFELVTRAVTGERYVVDPSLARAARGPAERFVFSIRHRDQETTVLVRDGFVTEEFIALARTKPRTTQQEQRLSSLKLEMAELVMSSPAADVYEINGDGR